jgi:hypothetical protein
MTRLTAPHGQHGQSLEEDQAGPWAGAWPELAAAGVALAGCSAAAFVLGGLSGVVVVVVCFSVLALAVLVLLLPRTPRRPAWLGAPERGRENITWVRGYWRLQVDLKQGTASAFAYQFGLRPHLEHLLAARLSERHGVNLYADPEAARRVLCARRRDRDLWPWVDPARPNPERNAAGIPPRTLARLVRRLEQL